MRRIFKEKFDLQKTQSDQRKKHLVLSRLCSFWCVEFKLYIRKNDIGWKLGRKF